MRFRTGRFAGCMAGRNCRNGSGRARRYWGIPAVSVPGAVHIAACGESALRRSGAGAPSLMCPEKPLAVETRKRGKPFLKACRAAPYGRCRAPIIFIRRLAVCNFRRPGSRSERFRNPSSLHGLRLTNTTGRVLLGRRSACTIRPARAKLRCWSLGCFALRRATLLRTARPFFQTVTPLILISRTPGVRSSDHAARPGGQLGVEREQVRRVLERRDYAPDRCQNRCPGRVESGRRRQDADLGVGRFPAGGYRRYIARRSSARLRSMHG